MTTSTKKTAKKTAKAKGPVTFSDITAFVKAAKSKKLPRGMTATVTNASVSFYAKGQSVPVYQTGDFVNIGAALTAALGIKLSK